jgi:uncharacterized protein VirK/YbjX
LNAIHAHYVELEQLKWLQIDVDEVRTLADLENYQEGLCIVLERPDWFLREGELTISLFLRDTRVYSLAFTLGNAGNRFAMIGSLQGRNLNGIQSAYKEITKRLSGKRPRDLLVLSLQLICRNSNIARILAISDMCRHHRHAYFASKLSSIPGTNYDQVWMECGGFPVEGGFFEIPTMPAVRETNKIPTRKRAQYRRRYELYQFLEVEFSRRANNELVIERSMGEGEGIEKCGWDE